VLSVQNLHKSYDSPLGPLAILRGLTLSMERGEAASIMGPSGCGKSTLLHVIGALDPPTAGSVTLDGANPYALSEPEQALFRNTYIGFVFQDHCLLPQLTVLENVLTPVLVGPPHPDAPARARRLLEDVSLVSRLNHRPPELSGGEKQRVAIARALIRKPALLLCDEPTGNLDRKAADAVAALLFELQTEHPMILVVATHSMDIAQRFHHRYRMEDGILCGAAI
jgi:lipoprotein-releasing system ATP-binding protein